MTTRVITPTLGILYGDAPAQGMIVVIFGAEDAIKWTYISPGHGKNESHHLTDLQNFTPLRLFGVRFGMCEDGRLRVTQFSISAAKYHDGTTRQWQGATDAIVPILPSAAGKVWRAVDAEFAAKARAS
jgi:hypothetical protein